MAVNHALCIVVVDDDRDTIETLVWLLQMAGHEVVGCHAGQDAIEEACADQADVVFIDLAMPEMDGYEVAHQLRQCDACKDALLIAVTGLVDEEHRQRAMQAGFDDYLVKPVDFAILDQALETRKGRHAGPA